MLRPRITPCLLVHNGGLVKTTQFGTPKYVGDPINAVKIFNEKQADELIVLDIDATTLGQEPNYRLIAQFAAECRMPLCYGGGVRAVDQVGRIIGLGVEKVAVSAAAMERPGIVSDMVTAVGGQSVVVVFDVKPARQGGYEIWTHNGTRRVSRDFVTALKEAEALGAGEIVINAIDRDGMMKGYDLALARLVRESVGLPLTILGGAGSLAHIQELLAECGVIAAAAGSLFVFKGPYRAVLINYPSMEQRDQVLRTLAESGGGRASGGLAFRA